LPLRDERVEYVSPPHDEGLRAAYRSARIAVFPLMLATANNALLEAMSCGLPIVASDVGGVREYLGPEGGVTCAPYDADALAGAIVRLLRAPALAARVAAANRRRALAFDYRRSAEQHLRIYDAVLAGRRP
jgi:glycosyltransferase involved in cell wall biosynthesis